MDSIKLGIFLIVIVCGAALGSDNEGRKEYMKPSSEPKPLNETKAEDENSKAGAVVAGASLGITVLTKILDALGNIERKIAIGVENNSGHDWEALNTYFYSGTSDVPLPKDLPTGKALLYNGRRKGTGPRGCVGVMSYYIPDLGKTISVMFSVPFDYNFYSNHWAVAFSTGKSKAEIGRYKKMYNGINNPMPFKGDDGWHERDLEGGFKVEGNMASSGTATLEIHVKRA